MRGSGSRSIVAAFEFEYEELLVRVLINFLCFNVYFGWRYRSCRGLSSALSETNLCKSRRISLSDSEVVRQYRATFTCALGVLRIST